MKKRTWILAVLAAVLALGAGAGSAWSYFTTYAVAKGGYAVELGDRTEIREEFSAWTKRVAVANEDGSQPVYIRVKAFCGSGCALSYSDSSGKWSPGSDGYYYYRDVVEAGQSTEELLVGIGGVPEGEDPDSFHVVVIYESTPAQYDAEGVPYADWGIRLDSGTGEGGGE